MAFISALEGGSPKDERRNMRRLRNVSLPEYVKRGEKYGKFGRYE